MNWINIKDQLPDQNTEVLVFGGQRFGENPMFACCTAKYNSEGWEILCNSHFDCNGPITHWMPK